MRVYDPDIRIVLYKTFINEKEFVLDPSTIFVNEMDICNGASRIDIAVINGKLHGYEIKSAQDNLERLPLQIEYYNKIFDKITIVTCKNHLEKVEQMVPQWWGIYYINNDKGKLKLVKTREAKINKYVDTYYLAQLLWKDELIELLNLYGINKGTKSKTRYALCTLVKQNVEDKIIKEFVRQKLKSRTSWRAVPLQQLYDDLY